MLLGLGGAKCSAGSGGIAIGNEDRKFAPEGADSNG
jgi:hypothetical protein